MVRFATAILVFTLTFGAFAAEAETNQPAAVATSKAEAMMAPLLDAPSGSVSIREKLTAFAEAERLPL